MSRLLHIPLQIHGIIRKAFDRFHLSILEVGSKIRLTPGHPHSFSAAAGGCLDHHRKTNGFCHFQSRLCGVNRLLAAGNHRNSGLNHRFSCLGFIAHSADNFCRGADKCNAALFAQLCKSGILRQEAKSRMDCLRLHSYGCRQNSLNIQVALAGRSRTDADSLVRQKRMQTVPICF